MRLNPRYKPDRQADTLAWGDARSLADGYMTLVLGLGWLEVSICRCTFNSSTHGKYKVIQLA